MPKRKTLFIIDDDITHTDLLKKYLADKFYFNTISFSTAEEALRNIQLAPAIVILDYNMNRINTNSQNGIEIQKQILNHNPKTYIILLSSMDRMEIPRDVIKYNAYDYVVKNPWAFARLEIILNHIEKAIRRKHALGLYQKLFFGLLFIIIAAIALFIAFKKTSSGN